MRRFIRIFLQFAAFSLSIALIYHSSTFKHETERTVLSMNVDQLMNLYKAGALSPEQFTRLFSATIPAPQSPGTIKQPVSDYATGHAPQRASNTATSSDQTERTVLLRKNFFYVILELRKHEILTDEEFTQLFTIAHSMQAQQLTTTKTIEQAFATLHSFLERRQFGLEDIERIIQNHTEWEFTPIEVYEFLHLNWHNYPPTSETHSIPATATDTHDEEIKETTQKITDN